MPTRAFMFHNSCFKFVADILNVIISPTQWFRLAQVLQAEG